MHPLKQMLLLRQSGIQTGVYSACTANEIVIEAVLAKARATNTVAVVEATANQVNQDGGYTGMKPLDFRNFVYRIADRLSFPRERLVLGGDHLGPLTWKALPAAEAMLRASELVKLYVEAGFTKIHLDTSMYLGDDDRSQRLAVETVALRGATLAVVAEKAYSLLLASNPQAVHPVYIVGSEVPIPGGAQQEEGIEVTSPQDFLHSLAIYRKTFADKGLATAWKSVIGFVVQPGVEFGDETVHAYHSTAAKALADSLKAYPELVFEGHSTDYQTPQALEAMVRDGIAILKVGPALTFALREGLLALESIEKEMLPGVPNPSRFAQVLEEVMGVKPIYWKPYYHGDEQAQTLARRYSFSDRCRYYLPEPEVASAIHRLLSNLERATIPATLLSQFLPFQYRKVMAGTLEAHPWALLLDRVGDCVDDYLYAVKTRIN